VSAAASAGRIGPNAIIRVGEALQHQLGATIAAELFALAGLSAYLANPPQQMVDETEALRLHALLRTELGARLAAEVSREAGVATAEYLLAHRIPKPVQALLRVLPAAWASRLLLAAIRRHAWTFAGSGHFEAVAGPPVLLTIRDNPLCRGQTSAEPVCDYYAATFEHLFRRLVHADTRVRELTCEASGDNACRFEVSWSGSA
jgi:divinyl protochlorophyllide a 8-vinyl-reductase